ncbi:hypothetical protein ACYSNV_03900 [Myroides sp. LJL119]
MTVKQSFLAKNLTQKNPLTSKTVNTQTLELESFHFLVTLSYNLGL